MRLVAIASIVFVLGCQEKGSIQEGVYTTCKEIAKYTNETVELKNGKFRYWFYSDVHTGTSIAYPLSGEYRISGSTLILDHPDIHDAKRTIAKIKGIDILWRRDGLDLWQKEGKSKPYAVLIRVDGVSDRPSKDQLPSIGLLDGVDPKR
jgi:hypothetical protein